MNCFTEEEKLILDMYRSPGKVFTIIRINDALPYVEDKKALEMMRTVIEKLKKMSDIQFASISPSVIS